MSEIILTVDTPVLKGEKGDKGDTGSFDYGELERIVELNLGDKLEKINKSLEGKVNTDESHSMVDNNVIATFGGLEKWVDNPFVTKDENGKDIEEPRTIVKMFDTKIDSQDLDNKMEEAKGELQTYIDENLEASKSGDMLRSVYDKDRDGVVDLAKQADNAAKVNGKTVGTSVPENAVFTDTTYKDASVTEAGLMSAGDKVKLNGIASGATRVEVVDALDSTDISKALSANQGKALSETTHELNTSLANINTYIETLEERLAKLEYDSGWRLAPLSANFTDYEDSYPLRYRRKGDTVTVIGSVKSKTTIPKGASMNALISTLPEGFRPNQPWIYHGQGSGVTVSYVSMNDSGQLILQRYIITTTGTYVDLVPANWLPINFTYLTDDPIPS